MIMSMILEYKLAMQNVFYLKYVVYTRSSVWFMRHVQKNFQTLQYYYIHDPKT